MPRPNATAARRILDRVNTPHGSKSTTSKSEMSTSKVQRFADIPKMPSSNRKPFQPVITFDQFMENTIDGDLDDPGCRLAPRVHTRSMSNQQKQSKADGPHYQANMSTNISISEPDGSARSSPKHINFDDSKSKNEKKTCKGSGPESRLEKFDRELVRELRDRIEDPTPQGLASLNQTRSMNIDDRKPGMPPTVSLAKSTVSGSEIRNLLNSGYDAEFLEAVERLAQADAACLYAGAVKAAEEAAANAPPELAEEAAAAGARDFHRSYQAQIIDTVDENVNPGSGCKPIEIIGYIAMTTPH